MIVVSIAEVMIGVAVGSPTIVVDAANDVAVGTAKDVVIVRAEAASMALPLIRRAPLTEAVFHSAGRFGATVLVAMNGLATIARGVITSMILPLKSREARAEPVGIVCPEMTLVGNAAYVW